MMNTDLPLDPSSALIAQDLALYTDLYELTMAQGYFLAGKQAQRACFDYFFRHQPFQGGFTIFAGLGDLIPALLSLRFDEDALEYLRARGFVEPFLDYLRAFRFQGSIWAVREGEVVFPLEPLLRVEGSLVETQLIESILLNILNFQTLVATKAARIAHAAGPIPFYEFGMRRAQGLASLQATRAALIGGAQGTSNTYAGKRYGLPVAGTQAHAWIQHFDSELDAFRAWAQHYPDQCVLLVDTYNTLHSGLPHAITIAHELRARGKRLRAIRLDSGDLAYLSKKARAMLDAAGLPEVQIYVTNQLDEHLIKSLLDQGAPIDLFGVGTRLVTGHPDAALDGVYKLCMSQDQPCLKVSDNFTKVNFPGRKALYRHTDPDTGMFYGDAIALADDAPPQTLYHPFFPEQRTRLHDKPAEALLTPILAHGQQLTSLPDPLECARYSRARQASLPPEHKRFANPHIYKVGVSKALLTLRSELYQKVHDRFSQSDEETPA